MYEDGALRTGCQISLWSPCSSRDLKVGQITTNTHTLFAGTCEVKIRFKGKGGHAAFPHEANDALVAASYCNPSAVSCQQQCPTQSRERW